jgi:hypothetical protein
VSFGGPPFMVGFYKGTDLSSKAGSPRSCLIYLNTHEIKYDRQIGQVKPASSAGFLFGCSIYCGFTVPNPKQNRKWVPCPTRTGFPIKPGMTQVLPVLFCNIEGIFLFQYYKKPVTTPHG